MYFKDAMCAAWQRQKGKVIIMVKELKTEEYDKEIANKSGLSIVEFKARWCTPCKLQKPVLELLAVKYEDQLEVFTCDIDEEHQLVNRFNIFSVPTMLFFQNGRLVSRVIGYKSLSILENVIKNLLNPVDKPVMAQS